MSPTARRPGFGSSYGIADADEGELLPWPWAEERLAAAHNYWVSTAGPAGPSAAPVWGLWRGGAFVFSTGGTSRKARDLAHDPRVVVHLESGDEVVILRGSVEPAQATREVVDEYEQKYAFRPDEGGEGWYALRPRVALAWRESDFTKSATRFDF